MVSALPPVVRMRLCSSVRITNNIYGYAAVLALRSKLRPSPNYAINIHRQRFIIERASLPDPGAGPSVVNRSFHHLGFNRIIVDVIHLLHEESFTEDWINILLSLPK
jgi:hypothetical protein